MADFYTQLEPFRDFIEFTRPELYCEAPEDWLVVLTDVRGSTGAIQSGHYKWVNMVGASTVVALTHVLGTTNFPFVFGGDGATAMIHESRRDAVERALRAVRANSRAAYDLELRLGIISHRELIKAGAPVRVARFQLAGGPSIAFFHGEGLSLAEKWVKSGRGLITDGPMSDQKTVLKGLSCRWAPIKSSRGQMLSILVKPRESGERALMSLARLTGEIHKIADLESPDTQPIKTRDLVPEGLWRAALAEAKLQKMRPLFLGVLKILFEMLLLRLLRGLGLKLGSIDISRYVDAMRTHSDYRKFDETLRMVVDCSAQMQDSIRRLLERERAAGTIFFGMQASDTALVTCFVERLDDGGHIHFIDGNDGGYAMAATELKAQILAASRA